MRAVASSGALLALALHLLAPTAAAQVDDTVRVTLPSCAPDWFDGDALIRALSVELTADRLRIEPTASLELALEASCTADEGASITLRADGQTRSIGLGDLAPSVRMRALALASRDFIGEVRARRERPAPPIAPPIVPTRTVRTPDDAALLASPSAPVAPAPETRAPWLALSLAARGQWLGTRVVAPALSVELDAQLPRAPVALYVAVDGLYAQADDALGEIRAFDVGVRGGARATLDLSPLRLSLGLGVMLAYARADASGHVGVRAGSLEGALVGIDAGVTGALAVSRDVSILVGIGVVAYLIGIEARAETRTLVSFRDPSPWASIGVGVALDP